MKILHFKHIKDQLQDVQEKIKINNYHLELIYLLEYYNFLIIHYFQEKINIWLI